MSFGIYLDSQTRDYQLDEGLIVNKNALLTEALMRLSCPIGQYINDPTFGINLPLNAKGNITKNQLIQCIQNALQPMIASGRVTTLKIIITKAIAGKYEVDITLIDHNSPLLTFTWSRLIS